MSSLGGKIQNPTRAIRNPTQNPIPNPNRPNLRGSTGCVCLFFFQSTQAVPRGPPIWIWIFDSPPIWGVKFVEKLGFPNIFVSEKKTY